MKWYILCFFLIFSSLAYGADKLKAGNNRVHDFNSAQFVVLAELVSQEKRNVPMFMGSESMWYQKWKILKTWKGGGPGDMISGYSGISAKPMGKAALVINDFVSLRKKNFDNNARRIFLLGDEIVADRAIKFFDYIAKAKNDEERARLAERYALKKIAEIKKECGPEKMEEWKRNGCYTRLGEWK